jgi:hypothetical protein
MYRGWKISRWETPIVDVRRVLLVSLVDAGRELTILLERHSSSERLRWRVRFRKYPAYRNIDEAFRLELWKWLDESGQRCGSTFTVIESPPLASWETSYLHEVRPGVRHYVIATDDDVVEVLSHDAPTWEEAEPALPGDPLPGKSTHLYLGEDDAAIEHLVEDLNRRSR